MNEKRRTRVETILFVIMGAMLLVLGYVYRYLVEYSWNFQLVMAFLGLLFVVYGIFLGIKEWLQLRVRWGVIFLIGVMATMLLFWAILRMVN